MAKHDESFKLEVVRRYLSESSGAQAIALRYGLDHSTLRRWVKGYQQHGVQGLRKENEYLRAEVAYLKKLDALVRANRQAAQRKRKP